MSPIQNNLAEQRLPQDLAHESTDTPALVVVSAPAPDVQKVSPWRRIAAVLGLGAVSALLYLLLFQFADQVSALAAAARSGAKYYALVPIGIALVFSFVHGAFTGRFWDLLGLKARSH